MMAAIRAGETNRHMICQYMPTFTPEQENLRLKDATFGQFTIFFIKRIFPCYPEKGFMPHKKKIKREQPIEQTR